MEWIKGSERFPEPGSYYVKVRDNTDGAIFGDHLQYTLGHWEANYVNPEDYTVIEWLDETESPSTGSRQEWVSVSDERKPKEDEWVIVRVGDNIIVDGMYQYIDGDWIPYNHYDPDTRVTHWITLPLLPQSPKHPTT